MDVVQSDVEANISALNDQLIRLGGRSRYQEASIISTNHFKTSRWVIQTLQQLGKRKDGVSLKLLEVGAINIQLQECKWLEVTAIDLNSQHRLIRECDFFEIEPIQHYDVVVCSMVINCVPEPVKRGEMLARLFTHLKVSDGVLLLVLPIRCIQSKFIGSFDSFDKLLQSFGFIQLLPIKTTPRLAFYVLGCNHNQIDHTIYSKSLNQNDSATSKDPLWMQVSRASVSKHIDSDTLTRFSLGLNPSITSAGPNEFSVIIPSWLLPEPAHNDKELKHKDVNKKNKEKKKNKRVMNSNQKLSKKST